MDLTPQQKSSIRQATVEAAQARIGIKEDGPPYDNRGVEVDKYLAFVGLPPGNPWCLAFAEYCVGLGLQSAGLTLAESTLVKTGYCPALADHARQSGVLISAEDVAAGRAVVRPGDIMLVWETFANAADDDYHHSGVVEVPPPASGEFHSIEGNTNTDGGSEGYIVARQVRNVGSKAGDGHWRYAFVMMV
jgi:hypothetical protein